jgi:hypothetical protein
MTFKDTCGERRRVVTSVLPRCGRMRACISERVWERCEKGSENTSQQARGGKWEGTGLEVEKERGGEDERWVQVKMSDSLCRAAPCQSSHLDLTG